MLSTWKHQLIGHYIIGVKVRKIFSLNKKPLTFQFLYFDIYGNNIANLLIKTIEMLSDE